MDEKKLISISMRNNILRELPKKGHVEKKSNLTLKSNI